MALPAKIRANMAAPFPAMVQGSGPITIGKTNGIWTVGASGSIINTANPGAVDTDYALVWDDVAQAWIRISLSDLVTPIINVKAKAFGAKGNGSADDYPAFNAAFSFLSAAGGGTLYVPAGNYLSSSGSISPPSNIVLQGAGIDATFLLNNVNTFPNDQTISIYGTMTGANS